MGHALGMPPYGYIANFVCCLLLLAPVCRLAVPVTPRPEAGKVVLTGRRTLDI